jgi:hypothetical protein
MNYTLTLELSPLPTSWILNTLWSYKILLDLQVTTAVTMKGAVFWGFWVVSPCSSEKARHFGGTPYLHLQGPKVSQARNERISLPPASFGYLLGLLFEPEAGGEIFLRNVEVSPNYTALQHRRPYSSWNLVQHLLVGWELTKESFGGGEVVPVLN